MTIKDRAGPLSLSTNIPLSVDLAQLLHMKGRTV